MNIIDTMNLPASTLTKNQKITRTKTIGNERLTVTIRHDDECGNGHNSFSITGDLCVKRTYKNGIIVWQDDACGMLHDEVARFFPDLAPLLKWHLCSTDGPMHYVANSIYHASDKDCWGLRKGEMHHIHNGRTGMPCWILAAVDEDGKSLADPPDKYIDAETRPDCPHHLEYRPLYRVGEGKEPDLAAARSCAIWPEAELADFTEEKLLARLPALLEEFKAAVESLDLVY